jgi:putative membrane protein
MSIGAQPAGGPPTFPTRSAPQRLHPLSIVVRGGRSLIGLLFLLLISNATGGRHRSQYEIYVNIGLVVLVLVLAAVSWFVTTWFVDGDAIQVDTGLIRRRTVRAPLARVQAVDVIEPWLARILGVAEVRVRTGGGTGADARLAYVPSPNAYQLRAGLLALAHGLPVHTPAPDERILFSVSNSRLIVSAVFAGASVGGIGIVIAIVAASLNGTVSVALGLTGAGVLVYIYALLRVTVIRIANEWGFRVSEAGDGLRITSGIGSRVVETVPYGRVQAVRLTEPLLWRPFGWCRLELHLAGSAMRRGDEPRGGVRKALLPVGLRPDADALLSRVLPGHDVAFDRAPRRARWKAPLSFHWLAAGRNRLYAGSVTGRVRRETEWVPLAKVQSIRFSQGPLDRILGLSSVHLDIAGRRSSARWRARSLAEVRELIAALPAECAEARLWELGHARDTRMRVAQAHPVVAPAEPAPAGPASAG